MTQDRQCTYSTTLRRVRVTTVAVGKAISFTHSECVSVAIVVRRSKRMRRMILPSVFCLAVPHVATLAHRRHDLEFKTSYWT